MWHALLNNWALIHNKYNNLSTIADNLVVYVLSDKLWSSKEHIPSFIHLRTSALLINEWALFLTAPSIQSLAPSCQIHWNDIHSNQSSLAISSLIGFLSNPRRLKLIKSRLCDMTFTRASCGFWALFGPTNYCTGCLICQILSNNDESKLFRSYIWLHLVSHLNRL